MARISSRGQVRGSFLHIGSPILASSDITPTQTLEPGLQVWLGQPQMGKQKAAAHSRPSSQERRHMVPTRSFPQPHISESVQTVLKAGHLRRLESPRLPWASLVIQNNKTSLSITQHFQHPPLPTTLWKYQRTSKKRCPLEPLSGLKSFPLCPLRDHRLSPILSLLPPGASLPCCLEFSRALANTLAKCSFP